MNNTKTTKRALLSSVMAMLLCRSRNFLYADSKWLCDKAESHRNGRRNGLLQYKGR